MKTYNLTEPRVQKRAAALQFLYKINLRLCVCVCVSLSSLTGRTSSWLSGHGRFAMSPSGIPVSHPKKEIKDNSNQCLIPDPDQK